MRVKCLAQEHSTMSPARARTRTARYGDERTNHEATAPPKSNLNQSPIIPKAILANLFTNLAWDNVDCLEETLTGEGTTHHVNGIIVQPQVYGPHLPTAAAPVIEK